MRQCDVREVIVKPKEAALNKERQKERAGRGRKKTELLQQQGQCAGLGDCSGGGGGRTGQGASGGARTGCVEGDRAAPAAGGEAAC